MANKILPPSLPVRTRPCDEEMARLLVRGGWNPVLARVFASRSIEHADEAGSVGRQLLSWKSMKGIHEAAGLLADAVVSGQRICIVADYDSDGATSCALCVRALRSFGGVVGYFVPNRFVHGYGLTPGVVDQVREEQAPEWIVTVDNGISSHDGVIRAREFGMQVLVTDHHLAPENLPDAACILNPNQPGCEFPSKNLAGCGVAFYAMVALREELKRRGRLPDAACGPSELLDYVAIGTIADVVRLDPNNRMLARLGLERIRQGRAHPGVAALFAVARRSMPAATSKDIGFAIGPRLNAAGRLDDMGQGIRCLLSDDYQEALELALRLDDLNTKRKEIEGEMREEAFDELAKSEGLPPPGICLSGEEFHEGVIGIVAGRIKERDHRPTVVFAPGQEKGVLKGSGRSIPGFHLRDALDVIHKRKPGLLLKFGGHAMAAGLSIDASRFEEFKMEFERVCGELLTEEALARYVMTDGDLPSELIDVPLAQTIAREVWGQGCPEPCFSSVFRIRDQRVLKDAHLKLSLEKDGEIFSAIWFFRAEPFSSEQIEAVFTLESSEFRGEVDVQLQLVQATEIHEEPDSRTS